ncbi:MAG: hypothetical protein D6689_17555 [Deltaproteobacteria bacterium]|nr:MAG: hypothetical protein D6689_17555 [Deltaproteobacteria bacterium]
MAIAATAILAASATTACISTPAWRGTSAQVAALRPAAIGPEPGPAPARARTLTVRVYADDDYRAQVMHWRRQFRALVRDVNAPLAQAYQVRLEIVAMRPWSHDGDTDLYALVNQLADTDPGDDVDWVVGLVSHLDRATPSFHRIGAAHLASRHIVLRGMNDIAERAFLKEVAGGLIWAEDEELYRARKRHKERAVFLHEWAHSLGALHHAAPEDLMSPSYSHRAAWFSPENDAIIRAALPFRGEPRTAERRQAERDAIRAAVARHERAFARAELAQLRAVLDAPRAPRLRLSARVPPPVRARVARAARLAAAGNYRAVYDEILPLTEALDDEPEVFALACTAAVRVTGAAAPAPTVCRRAAELVTDDASPLLELAGAHARAGDRAAALDLARQAHARLASTAAADEAGWRALATLYQHLSVYTWLDDALAHLPDRDDVREARAAATRTRHVIGLPADAAALGIPPADEGEYARAVQTALAHVYAGRIDDATAAIAELRRRWPNAPGHLIAQCDLDVRAGRAAAAARACRGALARWDGAVWAHYLLGTLAAQRRQWARARRHLQRAIAIEPNLEAAWRLRAQVCRRAGDDAALAELRAAFRARFGRELR